MKNHDNQYNLKNIKNKNVGSRIALSRARQRQKGLRQPVILT